MHIEYDMEEIKRQITNKIAMSLLLDITNVDKKEKNLIVKLMDPFIANGIPIDVSINILNELVQIVTEETNHYD